MAVRKLKGSWWVDFQVKHQRIRKRSPDNTKEGAQFYEATLRREMAIHGKLESLERKQRIEQIPTLNEFYPRWMAGYVVGNNRKKEQELKRSVFERHLLPSFGRMRLDAITSEDIEKYKAKKLGELLARKSINNHLVVLHKAYSSAKEWGVIREIPKMRQLKLPEPAFRYLSNEEVGVLLKSAAGLLHDMLLVALRTGLRYSELTALIWEDIDWEKRIIAICRSQVEGVVGNTKNNRIRRIPLTDDVYELLLQMRQKNGLIFQENSHHVVYEVSRRRLRKACERAGVQVVSWHDLRHTFASHLVARSAPLLAVQKLLGHSDIKMTMRYSHLGPDQLRDAVALLAPTSKSEVSAQRQPENPHNKNPA